jgi:putative hydrolase of the HAD superfamily
MQRYDTILFDLSSTLVNYRGLVVGWEAMERLGFTAVHDLLVQSSDAKELPGADLWHSSAFARLRQAWTDTLAGRQNLHLDELLREALAAQGVYPDNQLIDAAVKRYCGAISAGAGPKLGAEDLLRTLKEQGRAIGLISNTMWPGALHHADLERFGLAQYLDVEIYSADAGLWKPSAEVFLHALKRLGGSPERAFFVGDNPNDDIVGGHNAGMKAVWIVNNEYRRDAGKDADAIIEELPDLLDVLAKWETDLI